MTETTDPVRLLAERVKAVADRVEYDQLADAFGHWYLEERFALSESDASDALVGGAGDKGIDAYLIDHDRAQILLFQFKYSVNGTASFASDDANKVRTSLAICRDPIARRGLTSSVMRAAIEEIGEAIDHSYDLYYYAVVAGSLTSEARKELLKIEKSNAITILAQELHHILELASAPPEGKEIICDFPLRPNQYMEFNSGGKQALVLSVRAETLAGLRHDHGDQLFDSNVRYFLGKRGPNKDMIENLKLPTGREHFWFFHNGITAICDDYKIDADRNVVVVKDLQIVNGCQTTVTLHEAKDTYSAKRENPSVLLRLVRTGKDGDFVRNISRFTNTQSAVSNRDLMAHDPVQKTLEARLAKAGYFYERMRGQWDKLSKTEKKPFNLRKNHYRRIRAEDLAKSTMVWMGKPTEAKSSKSAHFIREGNQGFYESIFNLSSYNEFDFILAFWLLDYCEEQRKRFASKFRGAARKDFEGLPEEEVLQLRAKEYLLHAETHMAALMGSAIRKVLERERYAALIQLFEEQNTSPFDHLFNTYDAIISLKYKREFSAARQSGQLLAPQFSKDFKNKEFWQELQSFVRDQLEMWSITADPMERFKAELAKVGIKTPTTKS